MSSTSAEIAPASRSRTIQSVDRDDVSRRYSLGHGGG